jgi:L-threonylcarbamoyladenylate synthase
MLNYAEMILYKKLDESVDRIKAGEIGVIPTDTVYGLAGSALLPHTIEKIYTIKKRDRTKPMIVLTREMRDLDQFGISLTNQMTDFLQQYWPGPVSIVLPCHNPNLEYLHRGTEGIAFRLPGSEELREFLLKTGPIVATSANPQSEPIATTIEEARDYFHDQVDFYVDGGPINNQPSTIIRYGDQPEIIRPRRRQV